MAYLSGPGGAALQVLLYLREDRPDGGAKQQQDADDDDGNQRDDESVLDQTLAATAMEETSQHVFRPFGGYGARRGASMAPRVVDRQMRSAPLVLPETALPSLLAATGGCEAQRGDRLLVAP